jgi:hypothetical protein
VNPPFMDPLVLAEGVREVAGRENPSGVIDG